MLYQLTINWTYNGSPGANVLVYEVPVELDDDQQQNLVDSLRLALAQGVGALATTTRSETVLIRRVDAPGYPSIVKSYELGPVVGTAVVDPVPRNVSFLLKKSAPTRRPNRGRMYLGGGGETFFQGSTVELSAFTALQDMCQELLTLEYDVGQSASLVIPRWTVDGTSVFEYNDVGTFLPDPTAATQRRRLRK